MEILNSHINRSTAQIYGVGEIPLNGKGMPLTDNAEGEEIVKTLCESIGCLVYRVCAKIKTVRIYDPYEYNGKLVHP